MQSSDLTLTAPDGVTIEVRRWLPDGPPKAIVQIAHGLAEHAGRYARFAQRLTDHGYAVYAEDHRGHGRTAGSVDKVGYFSDGDGFATVVEDMHRLSQKASQEHPGLPVFLVGHSMGSFLSRAYAAKYGSELTGLVLSGTAGDPGPLGKVGTALAAAQARLRGRRHPSGLLNTLTFSEYNKAFKPARTEFDWLSRDNAEVDAYVADPFCGWVLSAGGYHDLLRGLASINSDGTVARVPAGLPIHVTAGDKDPVGAAGKGPQQVADQFKRLGVRDVSLKLWPGARHEILNETNRDEVEQDILTWLDAHLPGA